MIQTEMARRRVIANAPVPKPVPALSEVVPEKRGRGRPPSPPGQGLTARVELRLTEVQREKLEQLGGVVWVRARIDKARP